MIKLRVTLSGCDDNTMATVFVTEDQELFLEVLSEHLNRESLCGCQPTMKVERESEAL